jgi:hypothetical protein
VPSAGVDELPGRQQAALGVLPAHQRLRAAHPPAVEVDLGLVVQDELVAAEGPAQVAEQGQPAGRVHVEPRLVGDDAVLADLRLVHRDVGRAQHAALVAAVLGGEGQPDAGLDAQGHALDDERLVQLDQAALGERVRAGGAVDVGEQHGELVAAEPGHGVGGSHDRLESRRDLAEHEVAVVVAEGVVDLLEPVEVEEQHGAAAAAPAAELQRRLQPVAEQPAVRQAGELVVEAGPGASRCGWPAG